MAKHIYELLSYFSVFQMIVLLIIWNRKRKQYISSNNYFIHFIILNIILIILALVPGIDSLNLQIHRLILISSITGFLLLGPIFWFIFFRKTRNNPNTIPKWIHFTPALLFSITFVTRWIIISQRNDQTAIFTPNLFLTIGLISFTQLLIYILFAGKAVLNLKPKDTSLLYKNKNIGWLIILWLVYFNHWLFEALSFFLSHSTIVQIEGSYWLSSVSLLFLLLFITFLIIRESYNFEPKRTIRTKYTGSNLSAEQKKTISTKLNSILEEEKPFLEPELSLAQLAEILDAPSKHVSQVINEVYKASFFDFINKHRIAYAKLLLQNTKQQFNPPTIQQVYFEAGFSSKSTFNRVFKKYTGQTPTEFVNKSI